MRRGGKEIKAAHGLIIAADGLTGNTQEDLGPIRNTIRENQNKNTWTPSTANTPTISEDGYSFQPKVEEVKINYDEEIKKYREEYKTKMLEPLYDPIFLTEYSNAKIFKSTGPNKDDIEKKEISEKYISEGIKKYGEPFRIKDTKYNRLNNVLYDRGLIKKIKEASNIVDLDPVEGLALVMRESAGGEYSYVENYVSDYGDRKLNWNRYHEFQNPNNLTSSWNGYIDNPYSISSIEKEIYANKDMKKYFKDEDFDYNKTASGSIMNYKLKSGVNIPEEVKEMYLNKVKYANENYIPFRGEFSYYKNNKDTYNKNPNYKSLMEKDIDIIKNNPDLYNFLMQQDDEEN